jgi:hypothetical protein
MTSLASTALMDSGVYQIVQLLLDQQPLRALCDEAITSPFVGAERFERNFRRILRLYAKELLEASTNPIEKECAGFVRARARSIARRVRESLDTSTHAVTINLCYII